MGGAVNAGDAINYSLHKTVHVEDEEEKLFYVAYGGKIFFNSKEEFFNLIWEYFPWEFLGNA